MTKKLKILAASDIEGDSKLVKKLAERADKENVDIVVLCGDITGNVETKNLIKPFKDRKKHVLVIPGNHDAFADIDVIAAQYQIKNLHGYAAIYEGIGFFGAGGAANLPFFPGAITETEILDTLKKAHRSLKNVEKKVMITHMHPEGSISEWSGIPGSTSIRKAVKEFKPDLLIHGHIHEASGFEQKIGRTRVLNVGREGKIIEL
jgi:Icc-related predicted phosphoesterase